MLDSTWLTSYADALWARRATGEEHIVTSHENICIGGYYMLLTYLKWLEVSPLCDLIKNFAAVIFLNSCFLKKDCFVWIVLFTQFFCFAQVSKRWNFKTWAACYTKASKTRRGGYWILESIISVDVLCWETP